MSKEALLVPKEVDVHSVSGASSAEEAEHKMYFFVMNQEFSIDRNTPAPELEHFIVIKPGQKGLVQMGIVVPATAYPSYSGTARFRPGKHWLQFGFSTLPFSFPRTDLDFWKSRWRSTGTLLDKYFVTQPFPVNMAPDSKAPMCNSN